MPTDERIPDGVPPWQRDEKVPADGDGDGGGGGDVDVDVAFFGAGDAEIDVEAVNAAFEEFQKEVSGMLLKKKKCYSQHRPPSPC